MVELKIRNKTYVVKDEEKFEKLLILISRLGYDMKYYIESDLIERIFKGLKKR